MKSRNASAEQVPYAQLVKRVEVLEERMRAHFGVMAIVGAVLASAPNSLVDMLTVYRDRHLPHPGSDNDPLWSDVVIGNEVNAIIAVIEAQNQGGLRVIKGGLS